jgi:hypothetical protein
MQTVKLRLNVNPRGWIAAWFPGQECDGKLFWGVTPSYVIEIMYRRRLRKQTFVLSCSLNC